ncbi:MAG: hypothetical protein QXD19_03965, partial [Candidatus Bathyarchaeia archaeon]
MKSKDKASRALEKKKLKILLEIGNIGAKHAAKSLSKILKQPVTIDVSRVGMILPGMLPKFYHGQNMPATGVYIH